MASKALQEAHDLLTDAIKQAANEPSLGLYFVQQHVHKAVPAIVALKGHLVDATQDVALGIEDGKDALNAVKCMKEKGPSVIDRMIKLLNSANVSLQPPQQQLKGVSKEQLIYSVTEIAKDARNLVLQTSGLGSTAPVSSSAPESTGYVRSMWDTAVTKASSLTRSSAPVEINSKEISSVKSEDAAPDVPGSYVRSVFGSAIQRASSMGWPASHSPSPASPASNDKMEENADIAAAAAAASAIATSTASSSSVISMNQEKVEEGGKSKSEDFALDSLTEETYDKFQAEHSAKLEQWLDD